MPRKSDSGTNAGTNGSGPARPPEHPGLPEGHYVLCDTNKRPIEPGWQKRARTAGEAVAHLKATRLSGGKVGVIPASLGCAVVDIDAGGADAAKAVLEQVGGPVVSIETPRGLHLWFRGAFDGKAPLSNLQASLGAAGSPGASGQASGHGDLICSSGFCVLHDLERFGAGYAANFEDARDCTAELKRLAEEAGAKSQDSKTNGQGGVFTKGNRNNALNKAVFSAALKGDAVAVAEALEAARSSGLDEEEIARTAASAASAGASESRKKRINGQGAVTPNGGGRAQPGAARSPGGEVEVLSRNYTMADFAHVLKSLGIELRYNLRGERIEAKRETSDRWVDFSDGMKADFCTQSRERFAVARIGRPKSEPQFAPWSPPRDLLPNLILSHARLTQVDPVLDFFENCGEWDGTGRLDTFLGRIFDVSGAPRELSGWVSRYLFMGAVKRTLEPGHKLDVVPVLVGAPGIGKSTFMRLLFPETPEADSFFSDSLAWDMRPGEMLEATLGPVILEAAEMKGAYANPEKIKAFVSRTIAYQRLPYRRDPQTFKRRCILVGTAERECLPDDENMRRWCVIPTRPLRDMEGDGEPLAPEAMREILESNRNQLWAEAMCRVKAGEQVYLPKALEPVAREVNLQYRLHSMVLEEALELALVAMAEGEPHPVDFSLLDVFAELKELGCTTSEKQLSRALRLRGYDSARKRIDGRQGRVWNFVG